MTPDKELAMEIDYNHLEYTTCILCRGKKLLGEAVCNSCRNRLPRMLIDKLEAMRPGDGIAHEVLRIREARS
jgi:hypothetical protein